MNASDRPVFCPVCKDNGRSDCQVCGGTKLVRVVHVAVGSTTAGSTDVYEIVNPSDAYTLRATSDQVATAAILLLGRGTYGGHKVGDASFGVPFLMFLGSQSEEVIEGVLGMSFEAFMNDHLAELAAALESVMIGTPAARLETEAALALMPEAARQTYLAQRHERHRSSMNDIAAAARQYAARLREKMAAARSGIEQEATEETESEGD